MTFVGAEKFSKIYITFFYISLQGMSKNKTRLVLIE